MKNWTYRNAKAARPGLSTTAGSNPPHVVIVGAGVGGLQVAKRLCKQPVRITFDRRNHHLFQPLLYQVATADLSPSNIAVPIRSLFRNRPNVRVALSEAQSVDAGERRVQLSDGTSLDYDFLVLATGAKTSYFGHDDWAAAAPGLKSLEDAIEIRKRVLSVFERAEQSPDRREQEALLTDTLTLPGHPEVFVIGDMARFETTDGSVLPGVSPVAIQQGKHAATNIRRALNGRQPLPFTYRDKGSMATIGRNSAVADLRYFRCRGFPAWLAWLFLHLMYLVGFRNRAVTFFEWAYAYFSFRKGSRLITWDMDSGTPRNGTPPVAGSARHPTPPPALAKA